jgi:branched-subunit amino acid ABC-type transport system permease component
MAMTLQYGVTRYANLAHGELLTIGAFTAVAAQRVTSNLFVICLCGVLASGISAVALNVVILEPFRKRTKKLGAMLIVTFALSQIIQGVLTLIFGPNFITLNIPLQIGHNVGPFLWTPLDELIIGSAIAVSMLLFALLHFTSFGRAQRAVADNIELARVVGVKASRVIWQTWLLVGVLAGIAGVALAAQQGTFSNEMGFNYLLVTFAAVIIGGIGKIQGAIVGAVIIGMVTDISGAYWSSGYSQVFALLILLFALLLRPSGIFTTIIPDTGA